MNTAQQSLRSLVDKWLAPTAAMPARVTRFGRLNSNHRRYVRVEATHPTGMLAIFFFRHDDGWYVFPPSTNAMGMGNRIRARSADYWL
jgi:hypothetical protein